jgi:hypothetical protein
MQYSGRKVELLVGRFAKGNEEQGQTVLELSELDIEFEVTRSVEWYDNGAEITIYNPQPSTINTIMNDGNAVILKAGYENNGGAKTIFSGQIAYATPEREGKDVVLRLNCVQARGNYYQLARLNMSVSFSKGKKIRECLQEMCDYAGIVLRAGVGAVLDEGLDYPYRRTGTFTDVVRDFYDYEMYQLGKTVLYLDNNELIVMGKDKSLELEQVELTHETGLLSCTAERDESLNKVNFADDPEYFFLSKKEGDVKPKDRPSKEIDRIKKVRGRCLMNANIVPNCFVVIDSSDDGDKYSEALAVKGRYIVTECNYKGGNTGNDFTIEFTAQEPNGGTDV